MFIRRQKDLSLGTVCTIILNYSKRERERERENKINKFWSEKLGSIIHSLSKDQ
jgi:hypothetical protein